MASKNLKALVEQFPSPGENGKLSDPDKRAMDEAVRQIHDGGPENVAAVVDMIAKPGAGDDVKPRHLLHAWATYVGGLGESERREFADALARTLQADRPVEVKKFVIRQLQVAGGPQVVPALAPLLADDQLGEPAAQALLAVGEGAVPAFREALSNARGANRLTIVQALGVLADAESAAALRNAARAEDRELRLAALWALARIGDRESVDLLLQAADADGYERIKATKHCLLLAENLAAADDKEGAGRIYTYLRQTRTKPSEAYVRRAATRGLARTE